MKRRSVVHYCPSPLKWMPVALLLIACATAAAAAAGDVPAGDPVDAGREALDQWWRYPWYDSATDSIHRIDVFPPKTPWFNGWLGMLLQWQVWIAITLILGILTWLLARYWFTGVMPHQSVTRDSDLGQLAEVDRIEALPVPANTEESDLLSEAKRYYREGNLSKAIIFVYSYLLVELDKRQVIQLERGKTNRQYLREANSHSHIAPSLQTVMVAFEDAFFGNQSLSKARFDTCWKELGKCL